MGNELKEKLERLNEVYIKRVREIAEGTQISRMSNFDYVVTALVNSMSVTPAKVNGNQRTEAVRDYVKKGFLLREYLRWINDFEEFRAAEVFSFNGYFPDLAAAPKIDIYFTEARRRIADKMRSGEWVRN